MIWITPLMITGTVILALEVIVLILLVTGATFGSGTRTDGINGEGESHDV